MYKFVAAWQRSYSEPIRIGLQSLFKSSVPGRYWWQTCMCMWQSLRALKPPASQGCNSRKWHHEYDVPGKAKAAKHSGSVILLAENCHCSLTLRNLRPNFQKHSFMLGEMRNMDEMTARFGTPSNNVVRVKGTKQVKLLTMGNEQSRFTVVVAWASGSKILLSFITPKRKILSPWCHCPGPWRGISKWIIAVGMHLSYQVSTTCLGAWLEKRLHLFLAVPRLWKWMSRVFLPGCVTFSVEFITEGRLPFLRLTTSFFFSILKFNLP